MNLSQTEHWVAAAARWWLQSTHFTAAVLSEASAPASRTADQAGPVHVDVAAANRRDLHERCVRPDVPLVQ